MRIINDESLKRNLIGKNDLSEVFREDMLDSIFLAHFTKGELICCEGDILKYIYFLVEGNAKVFTTQENGKTLLLCFYQETQLIGEVEYFAKVNYTTNVEALTDVYCIGIDIILFRANMLNDNTFLRYISEELAKKLFRNTKNCSFNLLYPLEVRLATYILLASDDSKFDVNLTNLAELLATSYRHLTRVLAKFCNNDLLQKHNGFYLILNKEDLKRIANNDIEKL